MLNRCILEFRILKVYLDLRLFRAIATVGHLCVCEPGSYRCVRRSQWQPSLQFSARASTPLLPRSPQPMMGVDSDRAPLPPMLSLTYGVISWIHWVLGKVRVWV